jgi:hypothetical protein
MMQFHYVVGYDSDNDRWWLEADPEAYFSEGNVWDNEDGNWFLPEEGSDEEHIDTKAWRVLNYLTATWPSPKDNHG